MGKVLCLSQWKTSPRVGKHERHSLALIDILLPLKPNIGKNISKKRSIAYLEHHGMFMVEKPTGNQGQQIVDIACFRRAAHVVPTDIWPNRYWVNTYIDLETYNNVFNDEEWK